MGDLKINFITGEHNPDAKKNTIIILKVFQSRKKLICKVPLEQNVA